VDKYGILNEVLVRLFRDIMDIEEKAIITPEFKDITNNDMHVIEAIGTGAPKNMSSIARELSVTVGTLTIAMNSLVKKGYVVRERGQEDRRVVYISLSDRGSERGGDAGPGEGPFPSGWLVQGKREAKSVSILKYSD